MTPTPGSAPTVTTAELSRALAHVGVGLFGLRRLAEPDPLFTELTEAYRLDALIADQTLGWDATRAVLARAIDHLPGPIGALLREHRLGLADWLLLALAGETDDSYPINLALSTLQGPDGPARPTLHLCQALVETLLGERLSPVALTGHPLVVDGILVIDGDGPLTLRELRMPPALWTVLRGVHQVQPWPGCRWLTDELPMRLDGSGVGALVPATLRAQLPRLAELVRHGEVRCIALRGSRANGMVAAVALADALGLRAISVPLAHWRGQPALPGACRVAGWLPVLAPELGPGEQLRPEVRSGPLVLVLGREGAVDAPRLLELTLPALTTHERTALWQQALGQAPPAPLARVALLDGPAIAVVADRARLEAERLGEPLAEAHLLGARIQLGAERLRQLAAPVTRRVSAEALILPPLLQRRFDHLVRRANCRERVWDGLGESLATSVNTGVRALFVGDSGTGKTLAAARLATCLDAPLYRVDLAAVMNKYIGESEKNLGLLLDAAAAGDVMLLLDEADALFGRRGDSSETGERFANMLTNFLLTRIESHPGLVVLTSNNRARIDPAFTRRLDAILEFPQPAVDERRRLWRSHLGARSPGVATCDLLAAYCDLAGGHVRNAVLSAAARDPGGPGEPIAPALLVDGLRDEYRKLGRAPPPQLDQLA